MRETLEALDRRLLDAREIVCAVGDDDAAKPTRSLKLVEWRRSAAAAARECSRRPLTPMSVEAEAKIGQQVSLYCGGRAAHDAIEWLTAAESNDEQRASTYRAQTATEASRRRSHQMNRLLAGRADANADCSRASADAPPLDVDAAA